MSRPSNFFTSLAGVTVHYDREPVAPFGSRGVPRRFHATASFQAKLESCFAELWEVCGHGKAEVITSAGAFTEKPGMHGEGRAFDLDGIFWPDRVFLALHDGFNGRARPFYFAVEAVLRKHLGVVLDFNFNAAHRDHLHLDDSLEVGFSEGAHSKVLFLQGALTHVLGLPLRIDGVFGPESRQAVTRALQMLELQGDIHDRGVWLRFLTGIAERGFRAGERTVLANGGEQSPLRLLHGLYEIIEGELSETSLRMPVEAALSAFANHPQTQEFLEQFR